MPSDLVERQERFWEYIGALILWVRDQSTPTHRCRLAQSEGYVGDSINLPGEDSPHLRRGLHFQRLAQDMVLRVDGVLIDNGAHPFWTRVGEYWERLAPDCRWGGRFHSVDANHFSLAYGGYAILGRHADLCPFSVGRAAAVRRDVPSEMEDPES
jgi:hypothetical protein